MGAATRFGPSRATIRPSLRRSTCEITPRRGRRAGRSLVEVSYDLNEVLHSDDISEDVAEGLVIADDLLERLRGQS